MNISILILLICAYVVFESLSVAAESNGIVAYIETLTHQARVSPKDCFCIKWAKLISTFIKRCSPFCIVIRYIFNFTAAILIAWHPLSYIKHVYLHQQAVPPGMEFLILSLAIMFNCWSRMVYRVVGDRRVNREA